MPDLPLEHRLILYRDVPTTDRDRALRLEVRERDLHRSGNDHVEVAGRVVAVEDDLVAREPPRAHVGADLRAFGIRQCDEKRNSREHTRDGGGVHGDGTIRSERWATVGSGWSVIAALPRSRRRTRSRVWNVARATERTRSSWTSSEPATACRF